MWGGDVGRFGQSLGTPRVEGKAEVSELASGTGRGGGWELRRWPVFEKEAGRKGHKVLKLGLEQLQGDWERQGVGCGRKVEGIRRNV